MRRLLAAAALCAVALTSAACSNSGTPTTSPTTAAATSAAAAGGNTKEICDSINAAGEQLKTDVSSMVVVMGSTDPAQAAEALQKIGTALATFATAVQSKLDSATDPAFKAALDETKAAMGTAATKLADPALQKNPSGAVAIIDDPQISKALDDLGKFCPGIAG